MSFVVVNIIVKEVVEWKRNVLRVKENKKERKEVKL